MAKRGKKKQSIICSETLEEIAFENSILVDVVSSVPHRTRIHKKFEKKMPKGFKSLES